VNKRLIKLARGLLLYRYDVNSDMEFNFHTLAEVGAPFQQQFGYEIKKCRWIVQHGRWVEGKPHVGDFVIDYCPELSDEAFEYVQRYVNALTLTLVDQTHVMSAMETYAAIQAYRKEKRDDPQNR